MILRASLATACALFLATSQLAAQEPHRRLVISGDCLQCDFAGKNLAGIHILGGDFSGTRLAGAEMLGARILDVRLDGADLTGVSLTEAHLADTALEATSLGGARLDRARLHRVNLQNARLDASRLDGAVMLLTDLSGAQMRQVSAVGAVLRQSSLERADLRDADLTGAHIVSGRLGGADLRGAVMTGMIIENSDLTGADLRGAGLSGARFIAVNLSGADFRGAQGLDANTFRLACGDDRTRLPEGSGLPSCSEPVQIARFISAQRSGRVTPDQRARMHDVRTALEQSLAHSERAFMSRHHATSEAFEAARQGLRAAAEAMAAAELDAEQTSWRFEMRRSEIGEPLRVMIEQSATPPRAPRRTALSAETARPVQPPEPRRDQPGERPRDRPNR
jgi:uncharacterized protein YjbI with pentapeptide repeats